MRYARQATWLTIATLATMPLAALAQQAPPQTGNSGVLQPPDDIDPGIQAKPPVPSSKLPTKVIPPPGTPGGDPTTQPK